MTTLLLAALSSLFCLIVGGILGYVVATRSVDWAVRRIQDADHDRLWGGARVRPGIPSTKREQSGPVKPMTPAEFEAERERPMRDKMAHILGIKKP